jgi:DNA-binding CsgD family transcriptional regulator
MENLAKFSEYVGDIYDRVADPAGWPNTLQKICNHFGGILSTLAVLDTTTVQSRFSAYCGDPAVVVPLITTYAAHMPYYHVVPKLEIDTPYSTPELDQLAGFTEISGMRTGKFAEWSEKHQVYDALCLNLLKQENRLGTFVISTTIERPLVSRAELDELAILAPHIRRAVSISDLFEMEQREANMFRSVIEAFNSAVFIVSSDMKLVYANGLAETMLHDQTVVRTSASTLAFENPLSDAALKNAVLLGERSEIALGTAGIGVPLSRIMRPAIAHVLPIARRSGSEKFHARAAAAIFVASAGGNPLPAIEAFAALFGLTAAEKRVTAQVAKGMTRAEIAASTGVSDGTIKSQLDAVYDKTNTGNLRALENLIRELTPPVKNQ